MTTLLKLENAACSNGDVGVAIKCGPSTTRFSLAPGEKRVEWISTSHEIELVEFHPSKAPPVAEFQKTGDCVDQMIEKEVNVQIAMWGASRLKSSINSSQLLSAAIASASAIWADRTMPEEPGGRVAAFEVAKENYYPSDWDPTAFRDYGSDVANLIVAIALLRNQVLDMVSNGEDTTRSRRGEPYTFVKPMVTAQQAGAA